MTIIVGHQISGVCFLMISVMVYDLGDIALVRIEFQI
jgi:hypothetical protein